MALTEMQQGFLSRNIVVINGDISGEMVMYVKEALAVLYATKKAPDLTILISSSGGNVEASLDIFDLLVQYPGKKTAIVTMYARSAAATILQAADERLMTKHAYVLIHHVSTRNISLDVLRDKKKVQKLRNDMEKSQDKIYKILSVRTKKTVQVITKKCKDEQDMTAAEAIAFGLADRITTSPLPN